MAEHKLGSGTRTHWESFPRIDDLEPAGSRVGGYSRLLNGPGSATGFIMHTVTTTSVVRLVSTYRAGDQDSDVNNARLIIVKIA